LASLPSKRKNVGTKKNVMTPRSWEAEGRGKELAADNTGVIKIFSGRYRVGEHLIILIQGDACFWGESKKRSAIGDLMDDHEGKIREGATAWGRVTRN